MPSHSSKQRDVEFLSDGITIRGILQLPKGESRHPLVILGHGLGALKEWTLPELAGALVEVGIAGLWFDYRNTGDSDGEPREEVAHIGRIEDWQNAISYATTLPEIDAQRIGIWGTSLGGRDVLAVAGMDKRVKAVVSQTPVIKWSSMTGARMGGFGDDLVRYHQELAEDRTNRLLGKPARYIPFVKEANDEVKKAYVEQLSQEETRNYKGRLTLQSYKPTVFTDVTPFIEMIAPTPLLFILAEKDFIPGQREAFETAKDPKLLVTIPGDHFSPYTTSKADSIKHSKEWFVKYLC
ncbi:uncharacterized protein A1O9_02480 [Exophiala aquamarina CBS 119918]|uniref:AB hydrolase-1 domain-containing protein n=1 Tax=Exophiala aquamarina CBS 119918 TaxID=1182545 RepID=A0A072PM13_9EURO|nr:uncharacterized protein A1O9_02480 [Exophiala aquamarina CBS 119918]KEF60916.1 hypothetical protein A1O9_02480 [Exophiala aquamarina CBS 119918]